MRLAVSCVEVYRLGRWRAIDDRRIEWTEDTATIEAEISNLTTEKMQLRLKLRDGIREENYQVARVPYVCKPSPVNPMLIVPGRVERGYFGGIGAIASVSRPSSSS